ncbi:peptidoglycan DD-metalloendopeptidase family protein [Luteimonas sp. SX5]|uniref:Peptidoglycan DD-metalloendopeptidase family protein n=1 Tax=Luteimonas galliterrae TaxID=2940486 RepID=A0ABT0MNS6_9GAMM|nr:peptidoglycan DD-metalloendopeptidase family protein [Luteimonas galliterrae]MCL1635920.1 peptidoglycan DD-metalloendopeptidase family protein [Luteimonas galliterrae]
MKKSGSGGERRERLMLLREAALHRKVLAKLPTGFDGRWTRRHWLHASLFATLGALVAAIVPGFSNAMQTPKALPQTSLALALPPLSLAQLRGHAGDSWQIVSIERGETLSHVFDELGIPKSELQRVLSHPGVKGTLTKLKPGTELAFDLPVDGQLRAMRFNKDQTTQVELLIGKEKIEEKVVAKETDVRTAVLSGKVGKSLFRSARKAGLTGSNINALTDDIFKYDIDFDSDVGADDRFSVVVEQTWQNGELVKTGPVLAAAFTVDGKLHSGFRYVRNGKPEYFTAEGRPLQRAFIRMPIPYARLTSRFGSRRHPVLGSMRMHKGVDYAAGTGTPIMAAGDARVQFVGRKGGYGNAVILDHGRGYTTLYGHMSRFGKVRTGQRIPQGTVIGYVGSTGLATGPHLHYEFRINGVHRNPLSITMPPPEPLSGKQLASFRVETSRALAKIRTVENIIYAEPKRVATVAKPAPPKKG